MMLKKPKDRKSRESRLLSSLLSKKVLRLAVIFSCACSLFVTFFLLDSTEQQYQQHSHLQQDIPLPEDDGVGILETQESAAAQDRFLGQADKPGLEVGNAVSVVDDSEDKEDMPKGGEGGGEFEEEEAEQEGEEGEGESEEEEDQATSEPMILTIEPYHGEAAGGTVITVKGHNFDAGSEGNLLATVGGIPCLSHILIDSGTLTCVTPPGAGLKHNVAVIKKGGDGKQQTESKPNTLFSYDKPEIKSVFPEIGQTSGGTLLTIYGSNFGLGSSESLEVTVGSGLCGDVRQASDGEVSCVTVAQDSGLKNVSLSVGADEHKAETLPRPLFTYMLTPLERLKRESARLLDGLSVNFAGISLVFNRNATFQGNEFVEKDLYTGRSITYLVTPALRGVLPQTGLEHKTHNTCALVFNSDSLLGEKHGDGIDAHEAIFRFNNAPTRGFEAHVGKKTTYRFSQTKFLRSFLVRATPEARTKAAKFNRDDTLLVTSDVAQDFYVMLKKNFPYYDIYSITNSFRIHSQVFYAELQKRLSDLVVLSGKGSGDGKEAVAVDPDVTRRALLRDRRKSEVHSSLAVVEPLPGLLDPPFELEAILFAVQVCQSVDVYGFDEGASRGGKKGIGQRNTPYFAAHKDAAIFDIDQLGNEPSSGGDLLDPKTQRVAQIDRDILSLLELEKHVTVIP